jgi:hypothetical protein
MSIPGDVPQLAIPQGTGDDEAAHCLEVAARKVQEFSAAGGPGALDALLKVTEEPPTWAVTHALQLAETVAGQTKTLHDEVARFLSVTREY